MLRARKVSRNRNFDLFQVPAARRALRVHLMLQQLERDLLDCASRDGVVRLDGYVGGEGAEPRRRVLEIDDGEMKLRRRVYLTEEEVSLLLEVPLIASLLGKED